MAQWNGYLTSDELDELRLVAIRAGLATSRESVEALLSKISKDFAATLAADDDDLKERLSTQLRELNRVHNLRNGDVPLAQWLQAAIALAGGSPHVDFFEQVLDRVSHSSATEPVVGRATIGRAAASRAETNRAEAVPRGRGRSARGPMTVGTADVGDDAGGDVALGLPGGLDDMEMLPGGGGGGPAGPFGGDGGGTMEVAEIIGPTISGTAINTDVRPEAMIAAADDTVSVHFLDRALTTSRSVAKVLVHRHDDMDPSFLGDRPWLVNGTGWFIAPQLLITNHHVINARRTFPVPEAPASAEDFRLQAENTTVILDYFDDTVQSQRVLSGAGALVASDMALDFAILRLPTIDRAPLPRVRKMIRKTIDQPLGTRVNLLQHPHGQPMVLGFRDNFVVQGDKDLLTYLTDTNSGSSGSPVCNDRWQVAALHSGSRNISAENIQIRGHRVRSENFGIPIHTILDHLENHHPQLHAEIVA